MNPNEHLLKIAFSERARPLIFWTGAGASHPLPSWTGLRDRLEKEGRAQAELLKSEEKSKYLKDLASIISGEDLWLQFERLEKKLGRDAYAQVIKEAFSPSEKSEPPPTYRKIWELSPAGVVTLNLDLFALRAATYLPSKSVPIPVYPGGFGDALNVLHEKRPFIAYPHGHLDHPRTWTFRKNELERRLSDREYIEWLQILFRSATIIFIGITADDVAIGSPITKITRGGRIGLTGHFWITDRSDARALEWATQHGVRIVQYQNKSGKHTELWELLSALKSSIKTEDPEKEKPIVPKSIDGEALPELGDPQKLRTFSEEELRTVLNFAAAKILSEPEKKARDVAYQEFLLKYRREIHRAWFASVHSEDNVFLKNKLQREVTGGAFGTVYQGYSENGAEVAVKVLKNENFTKEGFHNSFRRGANSLRILSERNMPGVVKFIDAAEIPPTIIMEWCNGESLSDLVEAGQLKDWDQRVFVALELAKILRQCHGLPERVLHRDLRPANVMIENAYSSLEEWRLKVLDFDLSWHKGAEDHSIIHSPSFGYLAPEQREKLRVGARSALVDSFGFGMTVFYLCTGKNPYPGQHSIWEHSSTIGIKLPSCSGWRSLPVRLERLILNSTRQEQSTRLTMAQIEGELESIFIALTTSKKIPLLEVLTEELAVRVEHMRGYRWDYSNSAAILESGSGLSINLRSVNEARVIKFFASWEDRGTADWNHIERMLGNAVPKIEAVFNKGGIKPILNRKRQGFEISAELESDEVQADLDRFCHMLDKALDHASSVTNF